jgi:cytochrome o ubiquinol oxidase subunit IV
MSSRTRYITGFILSLVLTLIPAGFAWAYLAGTAIVAEVLLAVFIVSALVQLVVQLYFFLHVGDEAKPRHNRMALYLGLFFAAVIVGGSLWIMQNLASGHVQSEHHPFIEGVVTPQTSND